MKRDGDERRVIIFKSELLHDSEVFIREQVRAYSRWKAILAGLFPVGNLDFTGLDVDFLGSRTRSRWNARVRRVVRELNMSWPGTVRHLRSWNPSLLHIHFGTELVSMWPTARSLGVPVLTTLHGVDININDEWWRTKGGFAERSYPTRLVEVAADPNVYFVAVSDAIRRRAIDRGLPAEKVFTHHIGVDVRRFVPAGLRITDRKARILYVGRMVEKKGADILIEAFARVRGQVHNAELVMIGGGPLLEKFKQLAARLQVPVTFTGTLPSEEVKRHMDAARVFCLPSVTAANGDAEGFGLVLLEAQACGVPVVSSARGGATEGIKDGVTGFAFPERDIPALESALVRLLTDDALATSMAVEARRHVEEKFDIRRCTSSLEDFYDQICRESAAKR